MHFKKMSCLPCSLQLLQFPIKIIKASPPGFTDNTEDAAQEWNKITEQKSAFWQRLWFRSGPRPRWTSATVPQPRRETSFDYFRCPFHKEIHELQINSYLDIKPPVHQKSEFWQTKNF